MSLNELERMFMHVGDYYAGTSKRMEFVWHGGEPLLLEPKFFRRIEELQHSILDPRAIHFTNSVQTNLTVVNDEVLDLFRSFFDKVGVSLDLFGGQRVNVVGRSVESRVISNMQLLEDSGVPFGCITVLSRLTAPHVLEIYDFFSSIGHGFRLLPIYRTGYSGQQESRALTAGEILAAFQRVTDRWLAAAQPVRVLPIAEYAGNVVRQLDGGYGRRQFYTKSDGEVVLIVNTDGTVHSSADAYDPAFAYGNLFTDSLDTLMASAGRQRAMAQAERRMSETCHSCRFWGACWGIFTGQATPEQRWKDDAGRMVCAVAEPMHRYIEGRLRTAGLVRGDVLVSSEFARRIEGQPTVVKFG
jgi:uncharacterized protein